MSHDVSCDGREGDGIDFYVWMRSAFRTPICRAKRGGFKDTFPEDLLAPVLKVKFRQ